MTITIHTGDLPADIDFGSSVAIDTETMGLNPKRDRLCWGAKELSQDQKSYAANDVLYLHALKEKLDNMLHEVERTDLAQSCFDFLPTRGQLDLDGWAEFDIFQH